MNEHLIRGSKTAGEYILRQWHHTSTVMLNGKEWCQR
jgi:hypothetical protein